MRRLLNRGTRERGGGVCNRKARTRTDLTGFGRRKGKFFLLVYVLRTPA